MFFDFKQYLASLYPDKTSSWEVEVLAGGLVDLTVRARRTPEPTENGCAILILKYAPPYVDALGTDAPFTRAPETEAAALKLFEDEERPGRITKDGRDIRIPKVMYHDSSQSVLVLEDLGPLVTLWDFLSLETCRKIDHRILIETCADMGNRIGRFFADLHSATTQQNWGFSVPAVLENSSAYQFVLNTAVEPVLERIKSHGILVDTAERLYARALADYARNPSTLESVFTIADFHSGHILVDATWASPNRTTTMGRPLAIIDWEFATAKGGRGANGDMAQFLASLHLLLLSLRKPNSRDSVSPAYEAVVTFQRWVCDAYAYLKLFHRNPDHVVTAVGSDFARAGNDQPAVEREWSTEGLSVSEMVQAGAWYLERAGEDVEDMLEEGNWEELTREDHGVILRLFRFHLGR